MLNAYRNLPREGTRSEDMSAKSRRAERYGLRALGPEDVEFPYAGGVRDKTRHWGGNGCVWGSRAWSGLGWEREGALGGGDGRDGRGRRDIYAARRSREKMLCAARICFRPLLHSSSVETHCHPTPMSSLPFLNSARLALSIPPTSSPAPLQITTPVPSPPLRRCAVLLHAGCRTGVDGWCHR